MALLTDAVLSLCLLQGDAGRKSAAFAVAIGFPVQVGTFRACSPPASARGRGRVGVVSTFDLLAHLGSLVVADQLMANLLRYATSVSPSPGLHPPRHPLYVLHARTGHHRGAMAARGGSKKRSRAA